MSAKVKRRALLEWREAVDFRSISNMHSGKSLTQAKLQKFTSHIENSYSGVGYYKINYSPVLAKSQFSRVSSLYE